MKNATRIIYSLIVLYTVFLLVIFPRWTVDDAYITFRYADNLARHGELTWNVGEDPIEGYTGVALPVILAFFIKNGFEPSTVSQTIGVLSLLGIGILLYLFLKQLLITGIMRALTIFIYFTSPFLYKNAFSGLETLFFSLAVIFSLYILYLRLQPDRRNEFKDILFLLLLLSASLIRPEGVVLAGLSIIVVSFYRFKERHRNGWAFIRKAGLFYILPALIYFLWRWNYYGLFFPNTFYAKLNDGWIVLRTLKDLNRFFMTYLLIPILAALLLLWNNYGHNFGALKKHYKTALPRPAIVSFAVALAFILITSLHYIKTDLMMNFSYRFFLPFFPVLLVLLGLLLYTGLKNRDLRADPKRTRLVRPVLLILIIIYLGVNYSQLTTEIDTATAYRQLLAEEHIPAGKFLKENIPPSEWLSVYIDAGAIPYFSGLKTVDFGRLNDENLAGGIFSKTEIADYFFSYNPAAAVFTSSDWEALDNSRRAYKITVDKRFENYKLVRKYRSAAVENYYEFIYVRGDLAIPALEK